MIYGSYLTIIRCQKTTLQLLDHNDPLVKSRELGASDPQSTIAPSSVPLVLESTMQLHFIRPEHDKKAKKLDCSSIVQRKNQASS